MFAWGENAGFLVVLGLLALFEVLFVNDLQGNCHTTALMSSDFHCANWSCSEVSCVIAVLVGLVIEALNLQKLV